jgi:hypothetical protein
MGPLSGIAVETEEGWKVFKERVDIDVEYLRGRRILTRVPSRYHGDQLVVEDWAWMEGDHFCGRPRDKACAIGGTLHALGESLCLGAGPYNRPFGGQRLARSVIQSGIVDRVEQDGGEYQIQLRHAIELGPGYAIWVWIENGASPEVVPVTDWIQEEDACLVALNPSAKPVAFAISFRGEWQGARTCQSGWNGFADLILSSPAWETTAQWLKWWRVPLLQEVLRTAVRKRVIEAKIGTIRAWAATDDLQGGAEYSEELEDAWGRSPGLFFGTGNQTQKNHPQSSGASVC